MREDTQQGTVAKTVNNVLSPRAEGQDTGAVTLRRPPSSNALNPAFLGATLAEQRMDDVARNDRKQHDEKVTAQQCIEDRYTEHNGQED